MLDLKGQDYARTTSDIDTDMTYFTTLDSISVIVAGDTIFLHPLCLRNLELSKQGVGNNGVVPPFFTAVEVTTTQV